MRTKISRRRLWLTRHGAPVLLGLLLVLLGFPTVTLAHPLGNFTVNHYSRITMSPHQVRLRYVLDMAEIPTVQAIRQIDADSDGTLSTSERANYISVTVADLQRGLRLTVDDAPVELAAVSTPELEFPAGQGGLSLLRLAFDLEAPLPAAGTRPHRVEFENENDPERLGWREIVVQGEGDLKLNQSSVAAIDQSDELRAYPEDMLSSPLDDRSARFVYQVTDAPTAPPQAAPTQLGAAKSDGAFAALITLPRLNASVVLLALATALGLGALHALEPGHGKTAAAAYLVGSRATPWHALALGVTVTVMHTSSVFLLGLITLFASQFILPERLLPWLGLASGLIVIVLGLQMVWARLPRPGLQEATYGHAHDHHGPHSHTHDHHGHHHHHLPSALTGSRLGWRSVLAVGVSGGLLPCPAALVVLLSAIGLGRLGFGIALIVAFSAGLALVLTLIGLGMLYGGRLFARAEVGGYLKRFGVAPQLGAYLPAAGGLLVVLAGALLLYHSLPLLRIWQL